VSIDGFSSLLNHSCTPNLFYVSVDGLLRFRTVAPISVGEELLISYVNEQADTYFRHAKLRQRYGFECTCKFSNHRTSTFFEFLLGTIRQALCQKEQY